MKASKPTEVWIRSNKFQAFQSQFALLLGKRVPFLFHVLVCCSCSAVLHLLGWRLRLIVTLPPFRGCIKIVIEEISKRVLLRIIRQYLVDILTMPFHGCSTISHCAGNVSASMIHIPHWNDGKYSQRLPLAGCCLVSVSCLWLCWQLVEDYLLLLYEISLNWTTAFKELQQNDLNSFWYDLYEAQIQKWHRSKVKGYLQFLIMQCYLWQIEVMENKTVFGHS